MPLRPLLAILVLCSARTTSAAPAATVRLERAFPGITLKKPVLLLQAPGHPEALWAVEQEGRVVRFDNRPDARTKTVVIDLTDIVNSDPGEAGLLGLAFHPRFAENGRAFLSYTHSDLTSRLSEVRSPDGGKTFARPSEKILLEVAQPWGNHNGGHIAFGPDGYLYMGFGDGGSANDPQGNGQKLTTLLGKMLRLDVDAPPSPGKAYAIPKDNPLAKGGGAPEIFAWGLRNPWRFSFDAKGRLWAGDVGQNRWEEIVVVERGQNHGWRMREGRHCCPSCEPTPGKACKGTPPRDPSLTEPVAEYSHDEGDKSVTGGFVYRGKGAPSLVGRYIFGDFVSGRIFSIPGSGAPVPKVDILLDTELNISSFGEDHTGELYVLDYYPGAIFRIVER